MDELVQQMGLQKAEWASAVVQTADRQGLDEENGVDVFASYIALHEHVGEDLKGTRPMLIVVLQQVS